MSAADPPADPFAHKRALRARARRLASGVDRDARARRSREVEARLIALPELGRASRVALYAPLGDEVQLELVPAALATRGCRVAYPRLDGVALAFHWVSEATALGPGWRGILEPAAEGRAVTPDDLDVILVPGLLFDRGGVRLGRGGGHYDRWLASAPGSLVSIGLCLAEQLVDALPRELHDVPLRRVVTDREVLGIP